MLKMRQVCQPDYFGARDHVQGIRLVHHGLFGQDETANGGISQTDTHSHNNSTIRVVNNSSRFITGSSRVACATGVRGNHQCFDSFDRQRTCIHDALKLKISRACGSTVV